MSGCTFFCSCPDDLTCELSAFASFLVLRLEVLAGADCWGFNGCFLTSPLLLGGAAGREEGAGLFPPVLFLGFFLRADDDFSSLSLEVVKTKTGMATDQSREIPVIKRLEKGFFS